MKFADQEPLPDLEAASESDDGVLDFSDVRHVRDKVSSATLKAIEESGGDGEVLRRLKRDPGGILRDFHLYKDLPGSDSLFEVAIKNAVDKDPGAVKFFYLNHWEEKCARQAFYYIAEQNPLIAFVLLKKRSQTSSVDEELLYLAVLGSVRKDPVIALRNISLWGKKDYLMEALYFLLGESPKYLLFYNRKYSDYLDKKDFENLLSRALQSLVKKDPTVVMFFYDLYSDQKYADKFLMAAAKDNPALAIHCYSKYSNASCAKKILKEAKRKLSEFENAA